MLGNGMKRGLLIGIVLQLFLSLQVFAASPSSWSAEAVKDLKEIGYYSSDTFQNFQTNITRGEFIYLAVGMYEILSGQEIYIDSTIKFTDTDDVYSLKGASVGITSGIGNGKFGPDLLLTREQLATFLVRTLELLEVEIIDLPYAIFADDDKISTWARDSVYIAKNNGFISGVGGNQMNPAGNATVETAFTIIARILNESNGKAAQTQMNESVTIDIYSPVLMHSIEPMNYQVLYEEPLELSYNDISDDELSIDSYEQEVYSRQRQAQYYENYFAENSFQLMAKQELSNILSEENRDFTVLDYRFDANGNAINTLSKVSPARVITGFGFSDDFERISYYEKYVDGSQAGAYMENELEILEVWKMDSSAYYILFKSYYTGKVGHVSLAFDGMGEISEGVFFLDAQGTWFDNPKSAEDLEASWEQ